jgi:UDP-3-O-[3-hydroxymyristoyl] glucosamine N-acyltransferase
VPSRTPLTADRIADLVGGTLVGRGDVAIAGVAPLPRAGPGDLAFLTSPRYRRYLADTRASAVLLSHEYQDETDGPATRIVVSNPQRAAAAALRLFVPDRTPTWGVHPSARIGRGACWAGRIAVGAHAVIGAGVTLGADCEVGSHAVLEDGVTLGDHCRIEAHAVVHRGATLGDRVVVRSGARVGGDGFGFIRTADGHERVPQAGRLAIGSDVEIGANTTVDRGGLDDTTIGDGTKIDNLVQVAHNVRIGARCIVMAQVGIAGSVTVEDDALLAGQAGLADHLTVGAGARVAAQSGIIGDIPAGATVSGYPARDHRSVLRQTVALARLAPLTGRLERLVNAHDD